MPKVPKELAAEARLERLLSAISPGNQATVRDFCREKALTGRSLHTRIHYAVVLRALDEFTNGSAYRSLNGDQLRAFVDHRSRHAGLRSVAQNAAYLKAFLRWLREDETLPHEFRRALRVTARRRGSNVKPIDEAEFRALLEAAQSLHHQTLLWLLWDSGFRLGEALALRVGSVEYDDKGGALLRLPDSAFALKTGPRTIYVVDCVPALRAWISAHPDGANAAAWLFPSTRRPGTPITDTAVHMLFNRFANQAGTRHVWPHLFRHTRATRAARARWPEESMRSYFGWAPGSPMPSVYVHLAQADMEELVRRDAGIDEMGNRFQTSATDEVVLERRMKRALRRLLLEDDDRPPILAPPDSPE